MQVTRPSPYEEHLERLREKEWTLEDVPFYEPGQPIDFTAYESLHYLDVYDKVWGRECGENDADAGAELCAHTRLWPSAEPSRSSLSRMSS